MGPTPQIIRDYLMDNNKSQTSFSKWKPIEIMLAVLFLLAPFYYHFNIGGEGLRVPNNITVWIVATTIIWYSFYRVLKWQSFVIPKYFIYIAAFPILITLSGFVTGVEQPLKWLFRLLFIWGGLAFFLSLFQHGLKRGRFDRILFVIVLSALMHAFVSIAQVLLQADMPFWLPKPLNGVPSGLFQQINNQATYQVTAILIALYLTTRPLLLKGKWWFQSIIVVSVACAAFVLSVSGSRIGILSLILGLLISIPALWQRYKSNKKSSSAVLIALLVGFSTGFVDFGIGKLQGDNKVLDKTVAMQSGYSGSARLGMYSISLDLIKQQPVFGHGIGSFPRVWQYAKPDFYQFHPDAILPNKFVSHPHNETFFWLVEGGIIAGIGLLATIVGVMLALKRLGWQRGGAYAAILLPVGLHTQVELPFYTSGIHWVLFVLLLVISCHGPIIKRPLGMSTMAIKTAGYTSSVLALIALVFFAQTIRAHFDFDDFYNSPLSEQVSFKHAYANPYLRTEAQWIDMSSILYSSIEQRLDDNVETYVKWGEKLLLEKPDVALYQKLADGYYYLGKRDEFCSVITRGLEIYPDYLQFQQVREQCR
jgi:O-antigen ligase